MGQRLVEHEAYSVEEQRLCAFPNQGKRNSRHSRSFLLAVSFCSCQEATMPRVEVKKIPWFLPPPVPSASQWSPQFQNQRLESSRPHLEPLHRSRVTGESGRGNEAEWWTVWALWSPGPALTSWVTSGQLLNLSEPPFCLRKSGDND